MSMPRRFRHRVEIQAPPSATNRFNEPAGDWTTVATRWAAIEPVSGSESFNADQTTAQARLQVTLRYYAGLTSRHRLRFGGRQFAIDAPPQTLPGEIKVWHVLQVVERA